MMKKLKAIWELMRLEHGVMLFLAILVGSLISQKTLFGNLDLPILNIVLTFFTALFLEASTFALNDYYDLEIDRINKRTDRPLVRGDLSPKTALNIFYLLFPLGLLCSYFVNMTCFLIALITALISVLYDVKMKKIKFIGNFYIAVLKARCFQFTDEIVDQLRHFALPLSRADGNGFFIQGARFLFERCPLLSKTEWCRQKQ